MVKALFVLAVTASIVVLASAASSNAYCKLKSCDGPHAACQFPPLKTSKSCGKVQSSTLTSDEIQELLDIHNKYRALVASGKEKRGKAGPQPPATDIGPLKWDKELADIAQIWANQCHFGHKCSHVERFPVGQNAGIGKKSAGYETKLSDLVTSWYNEVELFDKKDIKSFPEDYEEIGHYTQLVWAKTKVVGCGAVRYHDGKWYITYLVCNYGPTGNMKRAEIYKTG